jgi:hypothetical protein
MRIVAYCYLRKLVIIATGGFEAQRGLEVVVQLFVGIGFGRAGWQVSPEAAGAFEAGMESGKRLPSGKIGLAQPPVDESNPFRPRITFTAPSRSAGSHLQQILLPPEPSTTPRWTYPWGATIGPKGL